MDKFGILSYFMESVMEHDYSFWSMNQTRSGIGYEPGIVFSQESRQCTNNIDGIRVEGDTSHLNIFFRDGNERLDYSKKFLFPHMFEGWHARYSPRGVKLMTYENESPWDFPEGRAFEKRDFYVGRWRDRHYTFDGTYFKPRNEHGTITLYEDGYRLLGFTENDEEKVVALIKGTFGKLKLLKETFRTGCGLP